MNEIINGNLLINGHLVELEHDVREFIYLNKLYIVLLSTRGWQQGEYWRNIWALDEEGKIIWIVKPADIIYGNQNSYTGISIKDGFIIAMTQFGQIYKIDPINGNVVEDIGFTK